MSDISECCIATVSRCFFTCTLPGYNSLQPRRNRQDIGRRCALRSKAAPDHNNLHRAAVSVPCRRFIFEDLSNRIIRPADPAFCLAKARLKAANRSGGSPRTDHWRQRQASWIRSHRWMAWMSLNLAASGRTRLTKPLMNAGRNSPGKKVTFLLAVGGSVLDGTKFIAAWPATRISIRGKF